MACGTTEQLYLQVSPEGLSKTTFARGRALNKEHLFRKMPGYYIGKQLRKVVILLI